MKSFMASPSTIEREWYVVDATGHTLGRLASEIGKKLDQKIYYHHSDYVGGMKEQTLKEKLAKKPEDVIYLAVKGMLPKGPLGRQMIKKLHVYAGAEHNHAAQQPKALEIKY